VCMVSPRTASPNSPNSYTAAVRHLEGRMRLPMQRSRHHLLCALLSFAPVVQAWVSISQARYGATIDGIYNESLGRDLGTNFLVARQQSLGYLWTLPSDPLDTTGLGGTITWAWDPALCARLQPLFKEDFWFTNFVDCTTIKASLHRAFETWAMNSRFVKFTDVTDQCERSGQPFDNCTHAELWITSLPATEESAGMEAANARQTWPLGFSATFRSTNGRRPIVNWGAQQAYRAVPEVQRGIISFQTQGICWYLDSQFCANWHRFKKIGGSDPQVMYAVGVAVLFSMWGIAMLFTAISFIFAVKRAVSMRIVADKDGDGIVTASERLVAAAERLEGFLAALEAESIVGTSLRFLLVMIPWPFFNAVRTRPSVFPFMFLHDSHVLPRLLGTDLCYVLELL
jgi:hypothetical protein